MDIFTSNLTGWGLVIVIVWQLISQIRSGNGALMKKMLTSYKERGEQLEKINGDLVQVVAQYKEEVAKLVASNEEKDKHNATLRELLQDKNPEVTKVLTEIRDYLKESGEKTDKVLSYQTEILEDVKRRNESMDLASKSHIGDLTRIP